MIRRLAGACLAFIFAVSILKASSGSLESLKSEAGTAWTNSIQFAGALAHSKACRELAVRQKRGRLDWRKFIQKPRFFAESPKSTGSLLGSFKLADRLDAHRALYHLNLGAGVWDVSMAADASFTTLYLSFFQPGRSVLRRLKSIEEFLPPGVDVQLDDKTFYQFVLFIDMFNPVRKSTLDLIPRRTRGKEYKLSTGDILDRFKDKAFVFKAGTVDYWVLYGTDVDVKTDQLAATRTILFVHMNGRNSQAWPVAESALVVDSPVSVGLGGTVLTLTKTSAGMLEIRQGEQPVSAQSGSPEGA